MRNLLVLVVCVSAGRVRRSTIPNLNAAKPVVTEILEHVNAGQHPEVQWTDGKPHVTWVEGVPTYDYNNQNYYNKYNTPYNYGNTYYNPQPVVAEVVQHPVMQPMQQIDPLMLMMLTDKSGSDSSLTNFMLLNAMSGNGGGMGNNAMLPLLLLNQDDDKTCEDKHDIDDKAEANPKWTTGDIVSPTDFAKVDYEYIGCVEHHTDGMDMMMMMPFLMGNGNAFGNGINGFDPLMFMLMAGNDGNTDDMLPMMMMMNNGGFNQGGSSNMLFWMTLLDKDCNVEHEVPDHFFDRDDITGEIIKITNDDDVKDFFKTLNDGYEKCENGGSSSFDDLLPFLMMQNTPTFTK